MKLCAAVLVSLCLIHGTARADPVTYNLVQRGWTGGGEVVGTFVGEDLNNDLLLTIDEVSAYQIQLRGNSLISNFTHNLADLKFFRYTLGSSGFPPSFPLFSDNGFAQYDADDHSIARSGFNPPFLGTTEAATVSAVAPTPEPASVLLLGTAIAGLFGFCRRPKDLTS